MLKQIFVVLAFLPTPTAAQSYLVEPTLAQCEARSAAQCAALGCDGQFTKYWWPCQPLANATVSGGANGTGGTTGLQIQVGDPQFGIATSNKVGSGNLTVAEQSALQTVTQLGTALPFVISEPTWNGHLSPPQISAINANGTLATEYTAIKATALVNLNSASVQKFLSDALAAGAISQATYAAMSTPQATIANP